MAATFLSTAQINIHSSALIIVFHKLLLSKQLLYKSELGDNELWKAAEMHACF